MAKAQVVDFSNVKDRGNFNTKRVPAGDYAAKIVKVEDGESSKDKTFQYIFTIKLKKFSQAAYPYYCKLQDNQLWKLRNLAVAAGLNVPKKRMKFDPNRVVGKEVGVTMEDDEYEGKAKSVVAAVFPVAELADGGEDMTDDEFDEGAEVAGDDDEDEAISVDDEEDEDTDDSDDSDDEEEEEEEEAEEDDGLGDLDRSGLKRMIKKLSPGYSVKRSQSDDDLREAIRALQKSDGAEDADEEEEEEEPEPPKKTSKKAKKKAAPADDDDEDLEELDIDDL